MQWKYKAMVSVVGRGCSPIECRSAESSSQYDTVINILSWLTCIQPMALISEPPAVPTADSIFTIVLLVNWRTGMRQDIRKPRPSQECNNRICENECKPSKRLDVPDAGWQRKMKGGYGRAQPRWNGHKWKSTLLSMSWRWHDPLMDMIQEGSDCSVLCRVLP